MSTYEAHLVAAEWSTVGSDTFQFWMAATFAVVIASYTAGNRLVRWARVSIASLYLLASVAFVARLMGAGLQIEMGILRDPESVYDVTWLDNLGTMSVLIVMLGGTILASILVLRPTIANRRESIDVEE